MDELKIVKTLGMGLFGTTYKVYNAKTDSYYALKKQKILKSFITGGTKYYMWRELKFYQWINKLNKNDQNFFMKMFDYKFYSNCSYTNKNQPTARTKIIKKLIKSKHCLDLLLDLKDGTVNNLLKQVKLTDKQIFSMIIQVTYICYLLNKSGYSHNDLHSGNIAFIKIPKNQFITIELNGNKYNFKSYGYQFSIIDYGLILHKKFILTRKEKKTYVNSILYNKDLKTFFFCCLVRTLKLMSKKFSKQRKHLMEQLNILRPELYKRIKILITSIYPSMIKYYNEYEKEGISNKLLLIEVIQYLVIYDKKFLSELFNEKIKPNRIEKNHLEFFKFNINNYENIVKYFIEISNN
jgi:hypothetical protein